MSALIDVRTIKNKKGMAIKFIVFQLVMLNMYPADKLAKACIEKTRISLNPWALNFSFSL